MKSKDFIGDKKVKKKKKNKGVIKMNKCILFTKNVMRSQKGFSLIEIMVGVAIIGVLGVTAVPQYQKYQRGAIESALQLDVSAAGKAYVAYQAVNGTYCGDMKSGLSAANAIGFKTFFDRGADHPNYKTGSSFGFGDQNASCPTGTAVNQATASNNQFFDSVSGAAPKTGGGAKGCRLESNAFKLGAYSEVSQFNTSVWVDENGAITKMVRDATAAGMACCGDSTVDSICT